MSVQALSNASLLAALTAPKSGAPVDPPHDGDGDAGDGASAPSVQAAPAPGTGLTVDMKA
jgi:hypothetical protein